MRHQKAGKKLSRTPAHRKALFENLITALLEKEKIETTLAKAQALRPIAEKVITLAKRNDLHSKRRAFSILPKESVVRKLFNEIAPRFKDRAGGYTRIIRTGPRIGDNAEMAIIELVGEKPEPAKAPEGKEKKAKKEKPAKAQ